LTTTRKSGTLEVPSKGVSVTEKPISLEADEPDPSKEPAKPPEPLPGPIEPKPLNAPTVSKGPRGPIDPIP
jgi:hypothetical protein